ncbi:hypothetical protein ABT112_27495 [Streptomyces sp. NPDC002055]|uniref:hypothetical protein n=1 Tax=Streptomyces sp. NPDC002055 TaxID=3154534 RepID=UPI00331F2F93
MCCLPSQSRTSAVAVRAARRSTTQNALAEVALLDAYAARDVLNHDIAGSRLTSEQSEKLGAVLTASGLGAGTLPPAHMQALTQAVDKAEAALRGLL